MRGVYMISEPSTGWPYVGFDAHHDAFRLIVSLCIIFCREHDEPWQLAE